MSSPTPPTDKTRNWPAYNAVLKRRGSLTIWLDPAMNWEAVSRILDAPHPEMLRLVSNGRSGDCRCAASVRLDRPLWAERLP